MMRCTECGEEYPRTVEFFHTKRGYGDGLNRRCKVCTNAYRRRRYLTPEGRRLRKEYLARHRAEIPVRQAKNYAKHREEIRQQQAAYYREHPELAAASRRNRRARQKEALGAHTAADIAAQYLRQHGRCFWCKAKVGKAYHVDHVIPLAKGGSNGPDNLVIACPGCNLSKGDRLPHEFSERMC